MRIHRLVIAAASLAAAASCSSTKSSSPTAPQPTIKMAHNDWLSAELNDTVAQILLQEQMGYTVEFVPAGTTDQWQSIADGALHVSLEVWPSGHPTELQKFLNDEKSVEDAGLLGPVARVGWFIPTYLLTAHPELATWEGLKNPDIVSMFVTPDTAPKGRFVNGDEKWVQWDQKIINNLELDFTVKFLGSEDAEIAALEDAYTHRKPILFYLWEPHWVFADHDLHIVELPAYDPTCWAVQKCSYPSDPLFKIVWPGLKDYAPSAYQFLKAFAYTAQDQVLMMNEVHNGATVEKAARDWVDTHKAVWEAWIPAKSN
jgi:glycine betaine/proline transport system substrate-binding protein